MIKQQKQGLGPVQKVTYQTNLAWKLLTSLCMRPQLTCLIEWIGLVKISLWRPNKHARPSYCTIKARFSWLILQKTILVRHVVTTETKAKCKSGETFTWENPTPKTLDPKKPKLQKAWERFIIRWPVWASTRSASKLTATSISATQTPPKAKQKKKATGVPAKAASHWEKQITGIPKPESSINEMCRISLSANYKVNWTPAGSPASPRPSAALLMPICNWRSASLGNKLPKANA